MRGIYSGYQAWQFVLYNQKEVGFIGEGLVWDPNLSLLQLLLMRIAFITKIGAASQSCIPFSIKSQLMDSWANFFFFIYLSFCGSYCVRLIDHMDHSVSYISFLENNKEQKYSILMFSKELKPSMKFINSYLPGFTTLVMKNMCPNNSKLDQIK